MWYFSDEVFWVGLDDSTLLRFAKVCSIRICFALFLRIPLVLTDPTWRCKFLSSILLMLHKAEYILVLVATENEGGFIFLKFCMHSFVSWGFKTCRKWNPWVFHKIYL